MFRAQCDNEESATKDAKNKNRINWFLYFSALSVNLATFGVGGAFSWSSPAIPRLNGNVDPDNNPLVTKITSREESWIASLLPLGAAFSSFLSGYLADKIGRKRTLLLFGLPLIGGFVLNAFATNVIYFYVGRILNGLCAGAVFTVVPIYVGEIAENFNRGILGCFFMLFLTLGILFSYSIGPYVTVKTLSLCNVIAPVAFLITFGLLVPETPYYLVTKNNHEKAKKALLKLRRNNEEVLNTELPQISENIARSYENKGGIRNLFTKRYLFKTLCITSGLTMLQQLTGINLVIFYMESIFEMSGNTMSAGSSTTIVGVVRVLSSMASSSLVDKLGRRALLLTSSTGMVVSLVGFATFLQLKNDGYNVETVYWLPVLAVIIYIISFNFGFGAVPFAMIGEIFPPHVKSVAVTLSIFICFDTMFCVTTFFPYLIDAVGMAYTFYILVVSCMIGGLFVYFIVPETKGKSLREIQDMLK